MGGCADQALQPSARIGGLALAPRRLCEVVHISLGLSWQVGFTRLAAVNSARPGQARVAVPSRSSSHQANKTWMPGSADKFMQSAQAWLRAGYDCGLKSQPMLRGSSATATHGRIADIFADRHRQSRDHWREQYLVVRPGHRGSVRPARETRPRRPQPGRRDRSDRSAARRVPMSEIRSQRR